MLLYSRIAISLSSISRWVRDVKELIITYYLYILRTIEDGFMSIIWVSLFNGMEWNDHAYPAHLDDRYLLCLSPSTKK